MPPWITPSTSCCSHQSKHLALFGFDILLIAIPSYLHVGVCLLLCYLCGSLFLNVCDWHCCATHPCVDFHCFVPDWRNCRQRNRIQVPALLPPDFCSSHVSLTLRHICFGLFRGNMLSLLAAVQLLFIKLRRSIHHALEFNDSPIHPFAHSPSHPPSYQFPSALTCLASTTAVDRFASDFLASANTSLKPLRSDAPGR